MKRRFPRSLWIGLLLVLTAPILYGTVFVRFPITRDVPWTMLLMFAAGLTLLAHATRRASRDRATSRGRVAAPMALAIAVAFAGFLSYAILIGARDLPGSSHAPRVGEQAPDFTLPDQDGRPVSLAQLTAPGGVVLVFYRGYW
jgi:cytochrome oxidase Cu insertion factor (SCO1/SenC/PrrC family)